MERKLSPERSVDLSVQQLPDELLIEIFSCLSSSEQDEIKRVCRHWYAILTIPFFTKNLTCHSVPDGQRCHRRSDMSCWLDHCTTERRTIRRRAHFSTPTALTFARRPYEAPVYVLPHHFGCQRVPCDIWLWMPRTITQVTFASVEVCFAQIVQLAKHVERVCLDKVELVGITSLVDSDAGGGFYRQRVSGYRVDYNVRIKRAILTGDFVKSLWDVVESVAAGDDVCPREFYIERIEYYMDLKVADPGEEWIERVDRFVRNVIAGRDPQIRLPEQGYLVDWTFPWHRLKSATLLELNAGLETIVGGREHQLTP